jgi:hypothetical protein
MVQRCDESVFFILSGVMATVMGAVAIFIYFLSSQSDVRACNDLANANLDGFMLGAGMAQVGTGILCIPLVIISCFWRSPEYDRFRGKPHRQSKH